MIQVTLAIYFVGVLLSGVQTGPELFIFSRFLTGIRYTMRYPVWEVNSQQSLLQSISFFPQDIAGE